MRLISRKSTRLLSAVFATLLGAYLCACEPVPRTSVYVIGDSLTANGRTQIEAQFAAVPFKVNGIGGIDLQGALDKLIKPAVADNPEAIVVELGINNAVIVWDSLDNTQLDKALTELDKAACTVWVTPTSLDPGKYDFYGTGSLASRIAMFKARLINRLPLHPRQRLADWSTIQITHPEWYMDDQLHLSPKGSTAMAAYMDERATALCKLQPTVTTTTAG